MLFFFVAGERKNISVNNNKKYELLIIKPSFPPSFNKENSFSVKIGARFFVPPSDLLPIESNFVDKYFSSFLHHSEIPEQRMEMEFTDMADFEKKWSVYQKKTQEGAYRVQRVSDSLFLTKKHVIELALQKFPHEDPVHQPDLFSRILHRTHFKRYMTRDTYAIRLF